MDLGSRSAEERREDRVNEVKDGRSFRQFDAVRLVPVTVLLDEVVVGLAVIVDGCLCGFAELLDRCL